MVKYLQKKLALSQDQAKAFIIVSQQEGQAYGLDRLFQGACWPRPRATPAPTFVVLLTDSRPAGTQILVELC